MNIFYCSHCDKETQGKIASREESINVRGENIKISSSILTCSECNSEMFNEDIEKNNLEKAYSEYRKNHGLLSPLEIKEIREKYNVSQRGLSRLLGWGEITLHRYESGAIQDEAHNTVLLLISQPENLQKIFKKNKSALAEQESERLEKKIEELLLGTLEPRFNDLMEVLLTRDIGELTGFMRFDLEKIKNMILLILEYHNTFATKINKLLWYMDFVYFNKYAISIAGNTYIRMQYGPVPKGYELILGMMYVEGLIIKEGVIRHKEVQELLKPAASSNKKIFSKDELGVINFVLERFKELTCVEISEFSHKEEAYLKTPAGEAISYTLAKTLSLIYK